MEAKKWALALPFNPSGSSPNTKDYLKFRGIKPPKDKKTKKESTGQEGLERLRLKHPDDPVIPKVLEARRVQKADMYFSDEHVSRDGRMHPQFTFHPDSGRLSSRAPNLNQIPQDRGDKVKAEVARAVRSTIIATPGFVLVEADWKAIEAVLVGYFAQDPDYIRASKLGVHDILGSHVLKSKGIWQEAISLSWEDARIKEKVSEFKAGFKTLRGKMKTVVHGVGYGRTPYAVSMELGCSRKEAQEYFDTFHAMAPKVSAWQKGTQRRAYEEGYLTNPFGHRRHFFDVLHPTWDEGKKDWKRDENGKVLLFPGDEANEALSFLPQSSGAGILCETILAFDQEFGNLEDFHMLVPIHDAILFEVRESQAEKWIKIIREVMERPFPQLNGLSVDVEIKMGTSWGEMEEAA